MMIRKYYSARKKPKKLTLQELIKKFSAFYLLFKQKDYFKEMAGIELNSAYTNKIIHKSIIAIGFSPFPMMEWVNTNIKDDQLFDTIEFLYDHVSKPGDIEQINNERGYVYYDYEGYDEFEGKEEFREQINFIIRDYKEGFELTTEGEILTLGSDGIQYILTADIIPYDEENVDSKVRDAIKKWRNRKLGLKVRQEAVHELADVFEWLRKTKKLDKVLNDKDESVIFNIANNFAIRHHDPKQNRTYNKKIWYSWMFHFYLATYHATIRMLIKKEKQK